MQDDRMKPSLSLVIPAYNAAAYLDRCMDSIVAQHAGNFEVVLVDDGSTDATGLLCDAWAARDGRIRVLHTENHGLSAARNIGFRETTGEYVLFVDADDELAPKAIETLVVLCGNVDMVAFGWSLIDEYGGELKRCVPRRTGMGNADDLIKEIVVGPLRDYAWSYAFRRNALEAFWLSGPFDETVFLYEDAAFLEPFLRDALLSVAFVPQVLYRHRRTPGSLSRKLSMRSAESGLDVARQLAALGAPTGLEAAWSAKVITFLLGADQLAPGPRSGSVRHAIAEEMRNHTSIASVCCLSGLMRAKLILWFLGLYRGAQVVYRAISVMRQAAAFRRGCRTDRHEPLSHA